MALRDESFTESDLSLTCFYWLTHECQQRAYRFTQTSAHSGAFKFPLTSWIFIADKQAGSQKDSMQSAAVNSHLPL